MELALWVISYIVALVIGLMIAKYAYKNNTGGEGFAIVLSAIPVLNIVVVIYVFIILVICNYIKLYKISKKIYF